MADSDVEIDGKQIQSFRVVELRKECDKRGLSKSGSKSQLVERLKSHLSEDKHRSAIQDGANSSDESDSSIDNSPHKQKKSFINNADSSVTDPETVNPVASELAMERGRRTSSHDKPDAVIGQKPIDNRGDNKENGHMADEQMEKTGEAQKVPTITGQPTRQIASRLHRRSTSSSSSSRSRSRSNSRSRSRSSSIDREVKKKPAKLKPRRRSTSSESSRSRSHSKDRIVVKRRSPVKERPRSRSGSSSSSSRSRSRSPTPQRTIVANIVADKKQRSASESSRSRSRSRSPKDKNRRSHSRSMSTSPSPANVKEAADVETKTQPDKAGPAKNKQSDGKLSKSDGGSSKKKRDARQASSTVKSPDIPVKVSKKISLNRGTSEVHTPVEGEKAEDTDMKQDDKPAKKRKWGSRSTSTSQKPKKVSSLPISTDSLKDIMPDMKPSLKLTETLVEEMDYEDDEDIPPPPEPREDTRDIKIQRTVVQAVEKPESPRGSDSDSDQEDGEKDGTSKEAPGQKESPRAKDSEGQKESPKVKSPVKKPETGAKKDVVRNDGEETTIKTIKITKKPPKEQQKIIRHITTKPQPPLVRPDEPEMARRSPSPARNPEDKIVHIRNLVRPFTAGQLKELLRRTGPIVEEAFWMDRIKSHCLVTFENLEDAVAARRALHNTTWPSSNPKTLTVDYGSEDQVQFHRDKENPAAKPDRGAEGKKKKDNKVMEKARLEREMEIERRKAEREKRMKERLEREEKARPKPIREWDREKLEKQDWDRTKVRSRSRSPQRKRSSSQSRERRPPSGERVQKEKREKAEKKEDEPPAKLLDDLFKKTKSAPSIYWLPLTEAQIAENEKNPRPKRPIEVDDDLYPEYNRPPVSPPRDSRRQDSSRDKLNERLMRLSDEPPRRRRRSQDRDRRR